jgi:hypothetical protein
MHHAEKAWLRKHHGIGRIEADGLTCMQAITKTAQNKQPTEKIIL